jgi:hypothetical protein
MPHSILTDFHRRLASLNHTRMRMESLYSRGDILLRDVSTVYESLFLRAVVGFEQFCEVLFLEILKGRIRYSGSRVVPRITHNSVGAMREVLLQGKPYLDWLPYESTEKRAKWYLNGGRPFTNLDDAERSTIKTIQTIRNAIAHSSDHALRKFRQSVIGNQSLLPRERTPAGFLRSQLTNAPMQRRIEVYVAELGSIAAKICGNPIP